ncbi:MAG: CPBP family intramembrane metalloprotease [Nitrosopumilaceae archaeon]|nr:CPBP family intramembrane metalloprotease [Nitrosopumilaceae archaeon]
MAKQSLVRQLLGVPHAALISVTFGLFLASFPMGAFVVFASGIGGDINYDLPLTHLDLFEGTGLHLAPSPVSVGDAFAVMWLGYLVAFAAACMGPARGFMGAMSDIMAGRRTAHRFDNYMLGAITWFSILVLASIVITAAQGYAGIETVPPESENDLLEFFNVTLAPIVEETGFRLVLVGIPVFLMYSGRFSLRYVARCLWRPDTVGIDDHRRALAVIVAVGLLFGFAHIALGEPWSEGKFAQAAAGGIILGWVYVRYGFVASVLVHWATNYFIFSHAHFISQTHLVTLEEAFSHPMMFSLEVILAACGILSVAAIIMSSRTAGSSHRDHPV